MALTDKLTAIGNAIREKTGKEELLSLDAMPEEIKGIETGGAEVYFSKMNGVPYLPVMELRSAANPDYDTPSSLFYGCDKLKKLTYYGVACSGNASGNTCRSCDALETVIFPDYRGNGAVTYFVRECKNLKSIILGKVGGSVTGMNRYRFSGCISADLVIELYVNAVTLADIPAEITSSAPWGATNATIVYRNSATGEVITE